MQTDFVLDYIGAKNIWQKQEFFRILSFAQVGDAEAWDLFIFLAGSTETHRENMIQPGGAVSYYSIHLL